MNNYMKMSFLELKAEGKRVEEEFDKAVENNESYIWLKALKLRMAEIDDAWDAKMRQHEIDRHSPF